MLRVGVYRIFGEELEKPVDDLIVALQLHNNRKKALHEVLDDQKDVKVSDWGQTNDSQPHEFVALNKLQVSF